MITLFFFVTNLLDDRQYYWKVQATGDAGSSVDGYWDAGYHQVEFNALNIASGSYFYRIKAGTFVSVKKLLLLE